MTRRRIAKLIFFMIMTGLLWFAVTQFIRGYGGLRYYEESMLHDQLVYHNMWTNIDDEDLAMANQYGRMIMAGTVSGVMFIISTIAGVTWFKVHTFKDEEQD